MALNFVDRAVDVAAHSLCIKIGADNFQHEQVSAYLSLWRTHRVGGGLHFERFGFALERNFNFNLCAGDVKLTAAVIDRAVVVPTDIDLSFPLVNNNLVGQ